MTQTRIIAALAAVAIALTAAAPAWAGPTCCVSRAAR